MNEFFCDNIKKLRLSKKLSKKKLAKLICVRKNDVRDWEHKRAFPDMDTLNRISTFFDVSIADLLSEKDLKNSQDTNKKKNNSFRKIVVSLSVLLLINLVIVIPSVIIYHPRSLSKYIESNNYDLLKIEVINYNDDITNIKKEDSINFLNEILNVKIIPNYIFVHQKVVSSFKVKLYYNDATYVLNNFYIYDGKDKVYFKTLDDIYYLVNKYVGGNLI